MFAQISVSKLSGAVLALSLSFSAAGAFAHDQILPDSAGSQEIVLADGREILADRSGLTVYSFDPDNKRASVCYDQCAVVWPPVVVAAGEVLKAPFGTTTRNDGTLQLTYDSMPLYNFQGDKQVGDINGDNLNNVWHLVVLE